MKYIKLFEYDLTTPVLPTYWLVPTDDRFSDSLKKIGISKEFNKYLRNSLDKHPELLTLPYLYVSYTPGYGLIGDGWGMLWYRKGGGERWYIEGRYTFGGNINIPDYELNTMKYNL